MATKFFVTGTDTGIGKTTVAVKLLKELRATGRLAVGLKPIATGATLKNGTWIQEDVLALQQASSLWLPSRAINPFLFNFPTSPNIAAALSQKTLRAQEVVQEIMCVWEHWRADAWVVEGVGGWAVPINKAETMGDVVKKLNIPVVMVVGIQLGCLNHALLTMEVLHYQGVKCLGWIANCLKKDEPYLEENIHTLIEILCVPCLGRVNYGAQQHSIDISTLLDCVQ